MEARKVVFVTPEGGKSNAEIDDVVLGVIGRVADKWTMSVLEVLEQNGTQMEQDGLVTRAVHPQVHPKVEYALTELETLRLARGNK